MTLKGAFVFVLTIISFLFAAQAVPTSAHSSGWQIESSGNRTRVSHEDQIWEFELELFISEESDFGGAVFISGLSADNRWVNYLIIEDQAEYFQFDGVLKHLWWGDDFIYHFKSDDENYIAIISGNHEFYQGEICDLEDVLVDNLQISYSSDERVMISYSYHSTFTQGVQTVDWTVKHSTSGTY